MDKFNFDTAFAALTGNPPFPWQWALYQRFVADRPDNLPAACNLPTGLGKTSVIAVWLLALAHAPARLPRRLVYVVNRRTVVDQATAEAEKLRTHLGAAGLTAPLAALAAAPADGPLAISTLRGQFADNRAWSADPARPAVIVGTVDMVGSRLLFSGYGCGFKSRPLHAGFLGHDALVVHDEAHLEPAFQALLEAIQAEQRREPAPLGERYRFRVMELTATSRGGTEPFGLTPADLDDETVRQRIGAKKRMALHAVDDDKKAADAVVKLALAHDAAGGAILVFLRRLDDVEKVAGKLPAGRVARLTGTLRGKERDELVETPIFQRFLPPWERRPEIAEVGGTVYLVCTSAGEVGVNISADHLVCDLTPFDSMAQRFGRVNRFGDGDAHLDVVYPARFDPESPQDAARERTCSLLRELPRRPDGHHDASPHALGGLPPDRRQAAFSPRPTILPVGDILFDAWALTTVRGTVPGRPPVADWLHGVSEGEPPETHFAWREEVSFLVPEDDSDAAREALEAVLTELFDDYPLRPHETLRDVTGRTQESLAALAEGREQTPAWVLEPTGDVRVMTLGRLAQKDRQKKFVEPLAGRTVLLPPTAGGLAGGMLNGAAPFDAERRAEYDVAGQPGAKAAPLVRLLVTIADGEPVFRPVGRVQGLGAGFTLRLPEGHAEARRLREAFREAGLPPMRVAYRIDLPAPGDEPDGPRRYLVLKPEKFRPPKTGERAWPSLAQHQAEVGRHAEALGARLALPPAEARAVALAGAWHDLGKDRAVWQRGAGNRRGAEPVAKTLHGRPPEDLSHFRHELASVIDVNSIPDIRAALAALPAAAQDLLLHLIAAHHGRARPHFSAAEGTDSARPAAAADGITADTPARFARLQRRFGRWGLAFLESLVRAADALDSRRIEDTPIGEPEAGDWPRPAPAAAWAPRPAPPAPTIRVAVDPTNPGQFFACCGLLELADRLWAGAEGWFEAAASFCLRPTTEGVDGSAGRLMTELARCQLTNIMTPAQVDRLKALSNMRAAERAKEPGAEGEKKELEKLVREAPIVLHQPFCLHVDWFLDERAGGSRFKTWAGQQSVLKIAEAMHAPVKRGDWQTLPPERWLTHTTDDDALPFNFDSDLGGQASALDVGFSLDPLQIRVGSRPLLELAAFVGLQRFRPAADPADDRYTFALWPEPLPPGVAAVAACGLLATPGIRAYEFRLLYRTKYLKSFLPATPRRGDE